MSLIANIIQPDGRPVCPMKGCGRPVDAGLGQAFFGRPDAMFVLFLAGELEQPDGLVIVHKACTVGSDEVVE